MRKREISPALRFAIPVMWENVLVILTTQIASMLIGRISGASLAAVGMVNQFIAFTTAAFTMITTGSAVLISRRVGAGDGKGASEALEQSISLLTIVSAAIAAVFALLAGPILRLLMPTAEDQLMGEALIYFRVSAVSLPFLMLETLLSAAQRAAGNSRTAMALGVGMNALLAVFAWLFIVVMDLGILGAGLSYGLARVCGCGAAVIITLRYHDRFVVNVNRVLKPNMAVWKGIFHMGAPMSAEQVAVQGGYLLAGSLVVGLGTYNATVYQVSTAVNNFTWTPNSVCAATAQTMAAMRLGEGDEQSAQRTVWHVWLAGAVSCTVIALLMAVFSGAMSGIYTSDASVIAACAPILWLFVPMAIPAMSINTTDAALRAGGDARYVMLTSLVGVWLIRLPLSWLLGYPLGLGVTGIYLANFASFLYRMTLGLVRFHSGRWIHR